MKKIALILLIVIMSTTMFFAQDAVANLQKVLLSEYKNMNTLTFVTMPPIKIDVALIESLTIADNVCRVVVKDNGKGVSGIVHIDIGSLAKVRIFKKEDAKKGTVDLKMAVSMWIKSPQ